MTKNPSQENSGTSKIYALFLTVLTIFIWGITFVSTKSLLTRFSSLEILFIRFIMAYIGLWIAYPHKIQGVTRRDNLYFLCAGLSGVTVYQFAENMAINWTTASNVSIIVSICPMFTAIIARIFLKERALKWTFLVGFIISILGVALVSFNGHAKLNLNPKGDGLAFLAAVCWGFYSLFVTLINRRNFNPIGATRRVFFFAIICMIPLVILGAFAKPGSNLYVDVSAVSNASRFSLFTSWFNLAFLGLGASAFCFSAWNKACETLGTVKVTTGIYFIPVVTIVFAFFALGEQITVMGLCGAALTIAGLVISAK